MPIVLGHGAGPAGIRTPDQRLRVFVSSTLHELQDERRAIRAAIERLQLAPVMFELGARPHPPRALYRSYLAQSDVFVGVYAAQYGWVAPDEDVSGLEDEYRLAPREMPRLVYLKDVDARDARLDALIDVIRTDDLTSYKSFASAEELAALVTSDLATMLAERFDAARPFAEPAAPDPPVAAVPAAFTPLIGRADDVAEVVGLLTDGAHRLVTLLGPGGIGKSRLALAVAEAASGHFPGGVVFVALENVLEPELLLPTIAYALGIRDTGEAPLEHRLAVALAHRRTLLVLDNFEQLVSAAPLLVTFFSLAPQAVFLVTSRVLLHVRGEYARELSSLPLPRAHDVSAVASSPAIQLFAERARAVAPTFSLTDANRADVVELCTELDGLPLAIELAAARTRVLSPRQIRARLEKEGTLVATAPRDVPERHRTLRATLEWSTALLDDAARAMLWDLGVFAGRFPLEGVEAIARGRAWEPQMLDALGTLIDGCLVQYEDVDGEPLYSMLSTVREHAVERLRQAGEERSMRDAHARWVTASAGQLSPLLGGPAQLETVRALDRLRANLRSAVRHLIETGDADAATQIAWPLYLYWWLRGYLPEVRVWMRELRERIPDRSPRAEAVAHFYVLWSQMWSPGRVELVEGLDAVSATFAADGDTYSRGIADATAGLARATSAPSEMPRAVELLTRSGEDFGRLGVGWAQSLCLVALARVAWARAAHAEAMGLIARAHAATTASGDTFTRSITAHHLGRAHLFAGQLDDAARLYREAVALSMSIDHDEGVAYAVEGLCAVAAARGDAETAAVLAGAAESIRQRVTMFEVAAFVFHLAYVERASADADPGVLAAAAARGRRMPVAELARFALAQVPAAAPV